MRLEIDNDSINELQRASIRRLGEATRGAHFINIRVRINGEWREIEADWLRHVREVGDDK